VLYCGCFGSNEADGKVYIAARIVICFVSWNLPGSATVVGHRAHWMARSASRRPYDVANLLLLCFSADPLVPYYIAQRISRYRDVLLSGSHGSVMYYSADPQIKGRVLRRSFSGSAAIAFFAFRRALRLAMQSDTAGLGIPEVAEHRGFGRRNSFKHRERIVLIIICAPG